MKLFVTVALTNYSYGARRHFDKCSTTNETRIKFYSFFPKEEDKLNGNREKPVGVKKQNKPKNLSRV